MTETRKRPRAHRKKASDTNRELTDYIKGVAILVVVANHFLNAYVSRQYSGYSNGVIAFFFVLSGYGLYHSMQRDRGRLDPRSLVRFFRKRFERIYPIYWIGYAVYLAFGIIAISVVELFAVQFTQPRFLWFIPAMVQCYIAAPFLYAAFRRFGKGKFIVLSVLGIAVLNVVFHLAEVPTVKVWSYRGVYMSHILLFAIGLALPSLLSGSLPLKGCSPGHARVFLGGSLVLFLFALQETTPRAHEFPGSEVLFGSLLVVSVLLVTYHALLLACKVPLMDIFRRVGIYTYSIYVFHGLFFDGLNRIGLIERHGSGAKGTVAVIILVPIFILAASLLEEIVSNRFSMGKAVRNWRDNIFH